MLQGMLLQGSAPEARQFELDVALLFIALPMFSLPLHIQEESHSINKCEKITDNLGWLNLALSGRFHFL